MLNHQNDGEMTSLDKARALRKDIAMIVLIIAIMLLVAFTIGRMSEIKDLKADIKDKTEKKVANEKHNKTVEDKQEAQLKDIDLKDVTEKADEFNNLFFNWDSWGVYDDHMKQLQQKFPKIDDGKVVDISGKVVGSGQSPVSTFDASYLATPNKGELIQFVEQDKESTSDQSSSLWYIVSDYKDGKFDIHYMKRYEEYNVT